MGQNFTFFNFLKKKNRFFSYSIFWPPDKILKDHTAVLSQKQ